MNPATPPPENGNRTFLERTRKALAHDLRTPLGTIVNYAVILESHESANRDEVRAFAGRIRQSATRLATMLQHMTDVTVLANKGPRFSEVEPGSLLRALLDDLDLQGHYPASGNELQGAVTFDPELLAFVWRSFLSLQNEVPRTAELNLDLEVHQDARDTAIELFVGPRPEPEQARTGFHEFAQQLPDSGSSEACV